MHNINTLNIDYDIIFTFNKKRRKKNLSMDYSFFLTNLNKYILNEFCILPIKTTF